MCSRRSNPHWQPTRPDHHSSSERTAACYDGASSTCRESGGDAFLCKTLLLREHVQINSGAVEEAGAIYPKLDWRRVSEAEFAIITGRGSKLEVETHSSLHSAARVTAPWSACSSFQVTFGSAGGRSPTFNRELASPD